MMLYNEKNSTNFLNPGKLEKSGNTLTRRDNDAIIVPKIVDEVQVSYA